MRKGHLRLPFIGAKVHQGGKIRSRVWRRVGLVVGVPNAKVGVRVGVEAVVAMPLDTRTREYREDKSGTSKSLRNDKIGRLNRDEGWR